MIAVTGATGLTGRFLLAALLEAGHRDIHMLTRPTSDLRGLPMDRIACIPGDCRDRAAMRMLLDGAGILVHVAGIMYAKTAIEACRDCGCARAIFVSTAGIYSRYRSLAAAYMDQEDAVFRSGLDYTVMRPTMIYGNERDHNLHRLIRIVDRYPVLPLIGGGRALMQPVHAGDLASALAAAVVSPAAVGRAYGLAGREPIAYRDILDTMARLLGKKRRYVSLPYSLALALGYLGELIPNGLVKAERIKRLIEDKTLDYSNAARDLGFAPRPFEDGIASEIELLKAGGYI